MGKANKNPKGTSGWAFMRRALLFVILTLLTQIGGAAFLAGIGLSYIAKITRRWARLAVFICLYAAATFAAHAVAPMFGRVPLSCFSMDGPLRVLSPLYCALNRNYVTGDVLRVADALSRHMAAQFPGTVTVALDANFPFLDGFPLLPHLSHDDGRKLDIAFYYQGPDGEPVNGQTRSPIGYFAFEQPVAGAPLPCAGRDDLLTFRWNFDVLQPLFPDWRLDQARSGAAVRWLATEGRKMGVEKIFIEPHLAQRLAVENGSVRFQGCRAARHDDHIHFQVVE